MKVKNKWYKNIYLLINIGLTCAVFSLIIGYATVANEIDVNLLAELNSQSGLVITNITNYNKSSNANSKVLNYVGTRSTHNVVLSSDANSYVTEAITITNTSNTDYIFMGLNYDSTNQYGVYTNINIIPEIIKVGSSLEKYDTLPANDSKTIYVKFSYKDSTVPASTELESGLITYSFINRYLTVTYDANGGSVSPASKQVEYRGTYGSLATPTKSGYDFVGWNGKNLFNKDLAVSGYTDDASGNVYSASNSYSTNYIEINSNTTYIIQPTLSSGNWGAFYDVNKNYISGFNYANRSITSPSNAKYIRFTLSYGNSNTNWATTAQIEEGSEATEYEPYYVTSSTIVTRMTNHTLRAIWEEITSHTISYNIKSVSGVPTTGNHGESLTINLSSNKPTSVTITKTNGGAAFSDYSYNSSTGIITINSVTEDLTITGVYQGTLVYKCPDNTYQSTSSCTKPNVTNTITYTTPCGNCTTTTTGTCESGYTFQNSYTCNLIYQISSYTGPTSNVCLASKTGTRASSCSSGYSKCITNIDEIELPNGRVSTIYSYDCVKSATNVQTTTTGCSYGSTTSSQTNSSMSCPSGYTRGTISTSGSYSSPTGSCSSNSTGTVTQSATCTATGTPKYYCSWSNTYQDSINC